MISSRPRGVFSLTVTGWLSRACVFVCVYEGEAERWRKVLPLHESFNTIIFKKLFKRWLLLLFKVFVLELLKLESTRLRSETFFLAERRYFYKSHACTWGCLKAKTAGCRVKACSYSPSNAKSWHDWVTAIFIKFFGAYWGREFHAFLSAYIKVNL